MVNNTTEKPSKKNCGGWLSGLGMVLAGAALGAEYGFRPPVIGPGYLHFCQLAAAGMLLGGKAYSWVQKGRRKFQGREIILDISLLLGLCLGLLIWPNMLKALGSGAAIRWGAFQIYLLILILLGAGKFSITAASSGRAPTRVLLASFAVIILMGTILLMLPAAHREGRLSFTDAAFTATSATCVTGLTVQETGGDFTRLGQMIILAMMQAGGLGIMIFGSLFAMLLGSPLSLRESMAMRDIMNEQSPGRIGKIVFFICLFTLALEAVGAGGLYGMWRVDELGGGQLFKSVFHSVSAFCNAGFSLQADSLEGYRQCYRVYAVICPLIILGGLGFPVLENIWSLAARRRRRGRKGASGAVEKPVRLTLHSKIVLTTTAVLLIWGWIILWILELTRPDGGGGGLAWAAGLDTLFNSVTARTAGFNTVDIGSRSAGAKLVLIFLMSVGGSPSSTAGGIKTVTLAVMVLAVWATIKRREQVQAFHRAIPIMIVRRAATLILLYGLLLWFMTLLLTITEHSLGRDMLDLLFEAASALGTVGLSTGITGHLTLAGKWVIIIAMFVGRLGPLSLLAALTFNARPIRYEYPQEPLVVG